MSNDFLPYTLEWTSPEGTPKRYTLVDVPVSDSYFGALAVEGCEAEYELKLFDWDEELRPAAVG